MTFTDQQNKALRSKLSRRHVKTRNLNGAALAYIGGYHAIAEANRIFGFDSWDRRTVAPRCLWTDVQRGQTVCFYSTKVRITVRAGDTITVREGIGTGLGRADRKEAAHDIALKAAETDATKRALATFGNPFGLALYNPEQTQVTKSRASIVTADVIEPQPTTPRRPLALHLPSGALRTYDDASTYVRAFVAAVETCRDLGGTYQFWEANMEGITALRGRHDPAAETSTATILAALRAKARSFTQKSLAHAASSIPTTEPNGDRASPNGVNGHRDNESHPSGAAYARTGPDAGTAGLAIPKERRLRDKDHITFVGTQPCLVCGRRPAHAHHLRFAQPTAMSMKVSDEYTVPLCAIHHDALHRTSDERAWWARNGIIEPLKIAERLWAASRRTPMVTQRDITMENDRQDTSATSPPAPTSTQPPATAAANRRPDCDSTQPEHSGPVGPPAPA